MKKGIVIVFSMFLMLSFLGAVYAEKLDIEVKDSYIPGDEVKFKVVLYDDSNNKIQGQINYEVQDYYTELMTEGVAGSGQEIVYMLPENARQGPWKITADYNSISANRLFNVGELQKAEIKLEEDVLIIKNVGNTPYDKKILIYIGDNDQTAQVYLEIEQEKRIRLTAPEGTYKIKVIEGNEENVLEFDDVHLTGNVIGLESVLGQGNFWQRYPVVALFLGALLLVVIVVVGLRIYNRNSK
ncbi:MAG: hypothetical protein PHH54_04525 [Candidatus Nanoarchaeia archaeon]|nr:hypothetical protein [Candidatus Nanoarchaeia archaeon]MDD5741224.1 hypothetical protein [Candidatus Nanoarchaeia archaeon]